MDRMDRIRPLWRVDPYINTSSWLSANEAHGQSTPKPLSSFMTSYQFTRYAQDLYAKTAAEGISELLIAAKKVQEAARSFLQPESSILERRTAVSSDPSVTAEAASGADRATYNVRVDAVAKEQENSGASFVKGSVTSIRSGRNEFNISMDGRSTGVSFWVDTTDTHEKALTKMRAAINAVDVGVKAAIQTAATGQITLELRGTQTGKAHSFTLTDVTGNAVSATGSHLVSQAAQDTQFRIDDGPVQTSGANHISLDKGRVVFDLHRPTDGQSVQIAVKADTEAVTAQVKRLAESYNDLLDRATEAGGYIHPAVGRRIRNAAQDEELSRLGLEKDASGRLTFDEHALAAQLDANFDQVNDQFRSTSGLASRLDKLAGKLESSPAEALLDRSNREYLRYANYQSTLELYSQLPFDGRLVNRYF